MPDRMRMQGKTEQGGEGREGGRGEKGWRITVSAASLASFTNGLLVSILGEKPFHFL